VAEKYDGRLGRRPHTAYRHAPVLPSAALAQRPMRRSGAVIGLSDHSQGNWTHFGAVSLGASLEKQLTSDKNWLDQQTTWMQGSPDTYEWLLKYTPLASPSTHCCEKKGYKMWSARAYIRSVLFEDRAVRNACVSPTPPARCRAVMPSSQPQ
jgi:hypothetical protein